MSDTRVHVRLPLPLGSDYDYALAPDRAVVPGDFVEVPLGRRLVRGVVWGGGPADPDQALPAERLKPVARRLPVPAMPAVTRRFLDWVADYCCADRGAVLRMAMSVPSALEAPAPRLGYRLAGPPPERMTAARGRVLDVLIDGPARPAAEIARLAGVSPGVVQGLVKAGTLDETVLPDSFTPPRPDPERDGPALNPAQSEAAASLLARLQQGFSVSLLDGVTGSGKTEVYFEAIARTLAQGRQVLVLLPEIALTQQWLARFETRFGAAPVVWHSELSASQRRQSWRAIAENKVPIVVGARSALFLPWTDLGLIVVDEEHEAAFKQEDGVLYQARDMAVVRASLGAIPIVLASATPSLESMANMQAERYAQVRLPTRFGPAELPDIRAIDLREDPPERQRWLSPTLIGAMQETLAAGEQVLLFLNRRGYAPLTLCRACGHRLKCPNCDTWLVEHRFRGSLQCHHCGHSARMPKACPTCNSEHTFAACGPGVERLLDEVGEGFPDCRTEVVSSDTVQGPSEAAAILQRIRDGDIDIVIGTQMIAKGHNFPLLTLVGVVDADLGLQGGDLRASERTYQLLQQVAGRAGRAERPGRAILQTWMAEHPVIQALVSGDRDRFIAQESAAREQQGLPPYGRLVALIVSAAEASAAEDVARRLARAAPRRADIEVLGPAPAPLHLLRGRYRQRLLMRTPRGVNASELTRRWLALVEIPSAVRVTVDVDPYSFL